MKELILTNNTGFIESRTVAYCTVLSVRTQCVAKEFFDRWSLSEHKMWIVVMEDKNKKELKRKNPYINIPQELSKEGASIYIDRENNMSVSITKIMQWCDVFKVH